MRFIFLLVWGLFLLNCGMTDESSVTGDCRQERYTCSADFRCLPTSSGAYECLPLVEGGVDAAPMERMLENGDMGVDTGISTDAASSDSGAPPTDSGSPIPSTDMMASDQSGVGEDVLLMNVPERCEQIGLIGPVLPAEAGHRVATILSPLAYPFAVTSIRYELLTGEDSPSCVGSLAHEVELMVIPSGGDLPIDPSQGAALTRQYAVPADVNAEEGRIVELTLPAPLMLEQDETLVVSVQLSANSGEHLCIGRCLDSDAPPRTDWWSNAAVPPYDWKDLVVDYQFKGALRTRAIGHVIGDE